MIQGVELEPLVANQKRFIEKQRGLILASKSRASRLEAQTERLERTIRDLDRENDSLRRRIAELESR